jgi:hypothetical protein
MSHIRCAGFIDDDAADRANDRHADHPYKEECASQQDGPNIDSPARLITIDVVGQDHPPFIRPAAAQSATAARSDDCPADRMPHQAAFGRPISGLLRLSLSEPTISQD